MNAPGRQTDNRPERWLAHLVNIPTAVLMVAEIVILFAGVTARFIVQQPLTWSDELASILFVWLSMLGSVIAFQHGQHMRFTAVVSRCSARTQEWLDAFVGAATVIFLLVLLPPLTSYAYAEIAITTPALGLSNVVRAAALPVGTALMAVTALVRVSRSDRRRVAIATAVLGAATALLWVSGPFIRSIGHANLILFFVVILLGAVISAVPIAFAFGIPTVAYLAFATSTPLAVMGSRTDEGVSSLILLAVPLFVFLGALLEMTGMASALVGFLASLLGHVRGGLNYVLLAAMYLVSGISGAKAADMAAVAPVLFPEMKRRGGDDGEMIALLAASAAMSETIPPSIVLITIGSAVGVSIAALFTGGLLPALVLALMLAAIAAWRARHQGVSGDHRKSARQVRRAFLVALPTLILPFAIRAAVIAGVATATELSTLAIVYATIVGLAVYRQVDWRKLYPMLIETAGLSGAILLIIGMATCMAWALTVSGLSADIARTMAALPGGRASFLAISIVGFVILGSILEGIPAIVLFGPLLFPVARTLGIHDVHYSMVVVLSMGLGLFSPPFGVGYYAACAIGRVNPESGMRAIWPYLGALFLGVLLVAAIPWLSTGFLRRP